MNRALNAIQSSFGQLPIVRLLQYLLPAALVLDGQRNQRLRQSLQQSQAELRDAYAQLGAILNCAPIGIVQTGLDGHIHMANPCYCQLVGHRRTRLRTLKLHDLMHPEDRPGHLRQHAQMLATGNPFQIEGRLVRADASHVWTISHLAVIRDGRKRPVRVVAAVLDISHRREAEAAMQAWEAALDRRVAETVAERAAAQDRRRRGQSLEALAQLAGGIAHDFNNVLQAVAGGARLIQRQPGAAAVERLAGLVVDAAERGAAVTQRLQRFAGQSPLRPDAVGVKPLVTDLCHALADMPGSRIGVEAALPDALPPVFADRGQLRATLTSLAANAQDAMRGQRRADGREPAQLLRLSAEAVDGAAAGLPAGRFVRIDVADTGPGMAPGVLERAIEPFFTTKAGGRGTGLGLAMAHGFAEQSGGKLILRSQVGLGTTASLFLPQASSATGPVAEGAGAPGTSSPPRIMLVDDDTEVLEAMRETLAGAGYTVSSFDSPAPALSHLENDEPDNLLISDLSMPGTDGVGLIKQAQRRWPGLPAILLTGYSREELAPAAETITGGRLVVLQKPIRPGALLEHVVALLDEHDAPPG